MNEELQADIKPYWEEQLKKSVAALGAFKESFKGNCITCSPQFRKLQMDVGRARRQVEISNSLKKKNESSLPIQSKS
jgi:hypothetical protein